MRLFVNWKSMRFVHVLVVAHPARQWVTKRSTNFADLQITSTLITYHYGFRITGLTPGLEKLFALETLPSTVRLVRVMCRPWLALPPAKTNDVNLFDFSADLDLVSTSYANPFSNRSLINN
jgi:hypothetical protein